MSMRNLLLMCACALLCACATPKAWQRGHLAQPAMAWEPDATDAAIREHTYVSKEAAIGGVNGAGGGCGCR
ncbi:MAG TPA: DUF4266 domain-containing protein [Nevskiaceae bacterium]|nr:DUF4266 domain-containing protein [Nevskiaceae bacterium]